MKYWIYIGMLVFSLGGHAQVPGYLGKRFSVLLDANPSPALLNQNTNNSIVTTSNGEAYGRKRLFAFNIRPEVELNYLLHRDVSVGLSYGLSGTGTVYGRRLSEDNVVEEFTPAFGVLKGQFAGVSFKFFSFKKSASIAPIGYYKSVSMQVSRVNAYSDLQSTQRLVPNDVISPVLFLGFGRQSMITRNVLLKTGVQVGLTIVATRAITEDQASWSEEEFSKLHLQRSIAAYNLVNFQIALGYIPF
jgi:hypothetical protein